MKSDNILCAHGAHNWQEVEASLTMWAGRPYSKFYCPNCGTTSNLMKSENPADCILEQSKRFKDSVGYHDGT